MMNHKCINAVGNTFKYVMDNWYELQVMDYTHENCWRPPLNNGGADKIVL